MRAQKRDALCALDTLKPCLSDSGRSRYGDPCVARYAHKLRLAIEERFGLALRRCPGARERDPVVTREDVGWGVGTVLAALLCLGVLPLVPAFRLAGRLEL